MKRQKRTIFKLVVELRFLNSPKIMSDLLAM